MRVVRKDRSSSKTLGRGKSVIVRGLFSVWKSLILKVVSCKEVPSLLKVPFIDSSLMFMTITLWKNDSLLSLNWGKLILTDGSQNIVKPHSYFLNQIKPRRILPVFSLHNIWVPVFFTTKMEILKLGS